MAVDGVTLAAVKYDLAKNISGARINKIYQPDKKMLTFLLRQPGEDLKLFISASTQRPRVHLTSLSFENPDHPPAFCMLLRKYLTYGTILEIKQPGFERVLTVSIENHNSLYTLILEIMGRYSNVILIDEKNNVLDALTRITPDMSGERKLYPGISYQPPPPQDKLDPLTVDKKDFFNKIPADFGKYCYKAIMYNFRGIGPNIAREIVFRAGVDFEKHYPDLDEGEKNAIWRSFNKLFSRVNNCKFKPTLGINDIDDLEYISAYPLNHLEVNNTIEFTDTGELFDYYYNNFIKKYIYRRVSRRLKDVLTNYLEKNRKKQRELKGKLRESKRAEEYKRKGELITAYIYKIEQGMEEITVDNYFTEDNQKTTISLDPDLSPQDNARKYFKKYEKAKKSRKHLKKQLGKFRHEERYLENVLTSVEQATDREELFAIEDELKEEGYIKKVSGSNRKNRGDHKKLPPRKYKSSQGYDILVGRNNRQNDELTGRIANNKDIWVHTKKIAGSHVIIRNHTGKKVPEQTIKEAARLAAYYSKGRMAKNVPVDYTAVKNVNKPRGARPGLVYYDDYKTLYVDPYQPRSDK